MTNTTASTTNSVTGIPNTLDPSQGMSVNVNIGKRYPVYPCKELQRHAIFL